MSIVVVSHARPPPCRISHRLNKISHLGFWALSHHSFDVPRIWTIRTCPKKQNKKSCKKIMLSNAIILDHLQLLTCFIETLFSPTLLQPKLSPFYSPCLLHLSVEASRLNGVSGGWLQVLSIKWIKCLKKPKDVQIGVPVLQNQLKIT